MLIDFSVKACKLCKELLWVKTIKNVSGVKTGGEGKYFKELIITPPKPV